MVFARCVRLQIGKGFRESWLNSTAGPPVTQPSSRKAREGAWFPPHSFTLRALGRDIAQILDFARSDFHVLGDRTSEHGILDEFKRIRLAWN